ncbi:MAG: cation:proton antiporter [Bradymonadaceae bacterium]|nr:cation:proton antiporter [Lujinxingiaceae bacterium]
MIELALILLSSAIAFGIARWFQLPLIPALIIGGFALTGFGALPERAIVEHILEMGLTFLVFVAGIEMDPKRVGPQKRAAVLVGSLQFVTLGVTAAGLSLAMGFDATTALYIGLAATASSTLVVVRLLRTRQQIFEPFGRLVIGVLLFQDLLIILLIIALAKFWDGAEAVAIGMGSLLVLVVLAAFCMRFLLPWLIRRFGDEEEILLLSILAVLFGFIGVASALELPLFTGAFLAGVAFSSFPTSGVVRGLLSSLSDFFLALFFTSLGALITIPGVPDLLRALALVALVVILTPVLVTIVAERSGLTARNAIEGGLLIAQTSEFSLIVGLQGLILGQITQEVFSIIALVTVVTMILTPILATNRVAIRLMRFQPSPIRKNKLLAPSDDHVVLIGCGTGGRVLLDLLRARGVPVIVIDHDPATVGHLESEGISCVWGEGSDLDVLASAHAAQARVVIVTTGRVQLAEVLIGQLGRTPVMVHVFEGHEAEQIRALGGHPILYSQAASDAFIQWFDERFAHPTSPLNQ